MARILIVTPADAGSRKGNRITALRWARLLKQLGHSVQVTRRFDRQRCDMLLALHARRSARAVERFAAEHPESPLVVALTGTDVYHDIHSDNSARRSLLLANRLVVLQPAAVAAVPAEYRTRTTVILQSAQPPSRRLPQLKSVFEVSVAGHLRRVKDPFRAAMATRSLPTASRIGITHIGAALTPAMAVRAEAEMAKNPRYHWLGDVPPARARQLIARARLLVLSSHMEGGANVICEAVVSGVPVLASRISGSVGMLGAEYPGFFETGDTRQLTRMLRCCEEDAAFYATLCRHCAMRAEQFSAQRELDAWCQLCHSLGVRV